MSKDLQTGADGPDVVATRHGLFGASGSGDTSGYGRLLAPIVAGGSMQRPYGGYFDEVVDLLADGLARRGVPFDDAVPRCVVHRGDLTIHVARDHLQAVAATLRDEPDLRFELCLGVSGVHYPEQTGRELHAVYPLRSITHNRAVLLETTAPDDVPHLPSLFAIYPTSDWHERETYDFFGLIFDGHPSLTRIEMPDDWEGHPQRKDYPLGGIPVEYQGATIAPPDQRRSYH